MSSSLSTFLNDLTTFATDLNNIETEFSTFETDIATIESFSSSVMTFVSTIESLFPSSSTSTTAAITPAAITTAAASSGAKTPTVSQLLNASNAEYGGGTPAGLTPFLVNGTQMSIDNSDGTTASVWLTSKNQVIVAFQGTTTLAQVGADLGAFGTPAAYTDALAFVKSVETAAAAQGIAAKNVFVTGHSLGGMEAEYVAQQTGLGGIGFEPTGLSSKPAAGATGANFADVVTYGDPVGNTVFPGFEHYGQVVMIGDPSNASADNSGFAGVIDYHLPGVQAYNLGVTLSPSNADDSIGTKSGPVLDAASMTIPQFIAAYATTSSTT